jgi:hypothetical protein
MRPGPLRWMYYAVGGRLPERCREWVLHDLTCRTWVFRHMARVLVQQPVWLLVLFVPTSWDIRWWALALAVSLSIFLSMLFIEDASDRKVVRHGYPDGLARAIREQVPMSERRGIVALYAARYRGNARFKNQ